MLPNIYDRIFTVGILETTSSPPIFGKKLAWGVGVGCQAYSDDVHVNELIFSDHRWTEDIYDVALFCLMFL